MALRVTSNMINTTLMRNLNRNGVGMQNLQNQLATGRQINKPSDNPVGITFALRYRSELSSNEQYQKNIDSAMSYLSASDVAIGQAGEVLQRVRELAVNGASGTNPQTALDSIRAEVEQLRDQMMDIGNSSLNGKYIFNGQTFDLKPYDPNSTTKPSAMVTDPQEVKYTLGPGVDVGVNVTGNAVFGDANNTNDANDHMYVIFDNVIAALKKGDFAGISNELGNIDSRMEKLLGVRAEVGARTNRVELMQNRMEDTGINLTDLQSKVEDADMAELIMKSKIAENIYNASLSVGSKIIQPTLVDFIR